MKTQKRDNNKSDIKRNSTDIILSQKSLLQEIIYFPNLCR